MLWSNLIILLLLNHSATETGLLCSGTRTAQELPTEGAFAAGMSRGCSQTWLSSPGRSWTLNPTMTGRRNNRSSVTETCSSSVWSQGEAASLSDSCSQHRHSHGSTLTLVNVYAATTALTASDREQMDRERQTDGWRKEQTGEDRGRTRRTDPVHCSSPRSLCHLRNGDGSRDVLGSVAGNVFVCVCVCLRGTGSRETEDSWIQAGFEGGIDETYKAVMVAGHQLN